ncbi:NAD(P)H-hydrate dehydratase [Nocardioides mangrovicus]|uniref:Bifunctional NAD(P)H-hydrate repair enzyme n=1 Tax=Nocardioides mangrovicus TaxID=2478913 RepID=A0A3L8P8B2_9ACTN|nr:NAD(P)H-hydrate dehydratase [Nocardioides mangrovicus]RLV50688.1 NAD(P)H-hydrate dehydratase [Nocardioides mangrovicus]
MRRAHTVDQVRSAEAELMARLPGGALMQRAAAGLAAAVADLLGTSYGARVLLLVGGGDNGGDALYAGVLLARRGVPVEVVRLSEHVHEAGLAALRAVGGRVVAVGEAHRPDLVVDGIVGIGGRPGLSERAVEALGLFPDVPVVAVDTPSGVDVDTGRLDGAHVSAAVTVTFGTHKVAHLVDPAAEACGVVHLVDIGLDLPDAAVTALQADDVRRLLRVPGPFDHKYTRGVVGVRAGSERYPGAAVLCTSGAACGMAGMVRYVGSAADAVRARHPEIVVGEGRVQAWVVGSGGSGDAEQALVESLADGVPVVADADAIQHVRQHRSDDLVLTPHAGELARLLDVERTEVEANQLEYAKRAAGELWCVVALKGRRTLVVAPDGRVRSNGTGVPWLGTAGAGDVLAGLVGALVASGLDGFDAASAAVWLHGAAAAEASAGGPIVASDVAAALPGVIRDLVSDG